MKQLKNVFIIILICLGFLFGCSSASQDSGNDSNSTSGDNVGNSTSLYNGGDLSNIPAQKVTANQIQSAKQRLVNSTSYLFPAEQTNSNILDNWNFNGRLKTVKDNSFSLQLYFDYISSTEIYRFDGVNKVSCSPVDSEDVYLSTYENGSVVQYSKNGKDITNGDIGNESYLSTKEGFMQCLEMISRYLLESIVNAKDYEPNDKNQYIFYVVRHFDDNSEQEYNGNEVPVYFNNEATALEDLKSIISDIDSGSGEDGANYYASFVFKYTLEFVGDYLKYEKLDYGKGFDDNVNPTSIIWHESPFIEANLTEYGTTEI